MSSVPFHYVDLRAFCYATEDEKRVEQALRTFLPGPSTPAEAAESDDAPGIERVVNEGHHGDRIVVLSTRLERADQVRHVLSKLAELPDVDRLLAELDDRVDDNTALFLHLDKQAAFRGDVERGEGISLRAKIEAYPATRENALANAREALTELRDEHAAATDGTGDGTAGTDATGPEAEE